MQTRVLVGLGNPGPQFEGTRHNLGVRVLRVWYETNKEKAISATDWTDNIQLESQLAELAFEGLRVVCVFPLTFVNNAGTATAAVIKKYHVGAKDIVLIHDELELDFGSIQTVPGGSAKGHNGVRSVHEILDTQEVQRVKVGIGRPPAKLDASDFVLAKFTTEEDQDLTEKIIPRAAEEITKSIEGKR